MYSLNIMKIIQNDHDHYVIVMMYDSML